MVPSSESLKASASGFTKGLKHAQTVRTVSSTTHVPAVVQGTHFTSAQTKRPSNIVVPSTQTAKANHVVPSTQKAKANLVVPSTQIPLPMPIQQVATTVTTPICYKKLQSHLQAIDYDKSKTDYLVNGFKYGFRLQHHATVSNSLPDNDHSVSEHHTIVQDKIEIELKAGRLQGPFEHPPFQNFHVSPIKIVEKATRGKFRLIHNLSWPYDESSINSQISDESKSVKYSSVQKAINLIMKFPKGSYTRKTDIQDAFKIIPIHPKDHHKLGFKFNNKFYYDITLPMGAGSACQIFESFSTALQAIYDYHAVQGGLSIHYLDDFFFIDLNYQYSLQNSRIFDQICFDIGVPQAPHKKTLPAHKTEFLGIMLNSLLWFASLPRAKLSVYVAHLRELTTHKSVTQKELQSVIGQLSFAATVVPARAFLRRLISKIHTVTNPSYHIKISAGMLKDIYMWLGFFQSFNGVTFFRANNFLPDIHYNMGADASRLGYGATFGSYWIQESYPKSWQKIFDNKSIGITVLELYPILVLIATFGHRIQNSALLFHSDNMGVVEIINKQSSSSKGPIIMNIVRKLVLLLMQFNIHLRSKHIPGLQNQLCDLISRFQITPSLLKSHGMNLKPTSIPSPYKANNFKLS
jgi:hypothetical protein